MKPQTLLLAAILTVAALAASPAAPAAEPAPPDVRAAAGIRAGLAVHVGATDGRLEIALARGGAMLVHALAGDEASLAAARKAVAAAGLYGLASVARVESFARLPYADDLVNLLVADLDALGARAPSLEEIRRVLAPFGAAHLKRSGRWETLAEPLGDDVDQWPQWDHGADGNPFSRDSRIAPTTALRWLAGATSVDPAGNKVGLRLAGGQVYYTCIDYDPEPRKFRPPRSDLFARDAFNGILRWKRPIDGVPGSGDEPPRFALAADDARVYAWPKEAGPLHALDPKTGKTLLRFEAGPTLPPVRGWNKWKDPVRKIFFVLRLFDGKVLQARGGGVYVSDAKTGRLLWKRDLGGGAVIGWAVAGGGKVFLAVADRPLIKNRASHATPADRILALDAETGATCWQHTGQPGRMLFRMIHFRDSLIVPTFPIAGSKPNFGTGVRVVRLRAADGQVVWRVEPKAGTRGHYPTLMARGAEVFVGQQEGFALDLRTGRLLGKYNWGQLDNSCADLKCTPAYTLYGLTFLNTAGERIPRGQTRSICDVGLFPAYGLLYGSPLGCLCSEYLNGYSALAPEGPFQPVPDEARLRRGKAFATPPPGPAALGGADEWPMHLADPRRSAGRAAPVAEKPALLWRRRLAARPEGIVPTDWADNEKIVGLLTAPTVAAGKVFLAAPDAHRLDALDAESGAAAWSFTAGARIDSPPTVLHAGGDALVVFGCRDGRVYCLRASDGRLAWRFLAAPTEKLICVQSQLESAWPVFGSVMFDDGGLIVAAGRQSAIDGGIYVWKLAPLDGRVLWRTRLWTDPDAPRSLADADLARSRTRNRRVNDLLVHNGRTACLWITPLKRRYAPGELVDIESSVYAARAMRYSIPSKDELRDLDGARWLWSAGSAGLLSRRLGGVGRYDAEGVNYADLNARKICLGPGADGAAAGRLYALHARGGRSRPLRGGLLAATLAADGALPEKPDWVTRMPESRRHDAMILAGRRLYLSCWRPREQQATIEVYSAEDGSAAGVIPLPARPVRDGLAAAGGRLYVACTDGSLCCLGAGPTGR